MQYLCLFVVSLYVCFFACAPSIVNAYMGTLYLILYIVLHNCKICMRKWMSHKYRLYTHASTLYICIYSGMRKFGNPL